MARSFCAPWIVFYASADADLCVRVGGSSIEQAQMQHYSIYTTEIASYTVFADQISLERIQHGLLIVIEKLIDPGVDCRSSSRCEIRKSMVVRHHVGKCASIR